MNVVFRFLNILFPALFFVILIASGCEQKRQDGKRKAFEKYFDDSLAKLSGPVAIMHFEIKLNRQLNCLLREAFDDSRQTRDNTISSKEDKVSQDLLSRL